jgi:hypothetical protein
MIWGSWQPFHSDWNRRYIPSRGLAYSFVIHEIAFFLSFSYSMLVAKPPVVLLTPEQDVQQAEVLYLPSTGGGDSGSNEGKRGSEGQGEPASGARHEGVTFRGPQYIRSDFSDPDNNLQTILQPVLTQPLKLDFPIQVPNSVRIARPKPQNIAPPKVQAKAALKDIPLPAPTEKPVLKAEAQPISTPLHSERVPLLPMPEMKTTPRLLTAADAGHGATKGDPPQETIMVKPEERREAPPVITANASMAEQSLAVLNAVHVSAPRLVIPPGVKHASFEVSPVGTGTAHAGVTHAGVPTGKPGAGSGSGSGTAKAGVGGGGSGSGKAGTVGGKSGSGPGSGDSGNGSGRGSAGKGTGAAGHGGNGYGNGNGSGNGNGRGAGTGSGGGPGDGPFPGIQVIGGEGSGMASGAMPHMPPRTPGPRNYDLTIVAAGGSGGGLKDFGVFHNEAVYTVYIDVSDIAPTSEAWVLQYANTGSGARTAQLTMGNDGALSAPQAMLEPPYALHKEMPQKLISPPNNAMTVLTGIISREGKFENARILQAPNEACGKQWVEALGNWKFRPASKDGTAVPVRVLIGIPVF